MLFSGWSSSPWDPQQLQLAQGWSWDAALQRAAMLAVVGSAAVLCCKLFPSPYHGFFLGGVSTNKSSAVKHSWFSWTNLVKISTILSKYFRGEVADSFLLLCTYLHIWIYIYMRRSRSATPLKDLKIFSPGCVWNLSYFQHVANLHFLLILSTLLCYSSLCFTS